MNVIFDLSYAGLYCVMLCAALLLREVIGDTVRLKRLSGEFRVEHPWEALTAGTPAPSFAAPLLGSRVVFRTENLQGHATLLIFVSPDGYSRLAGYKNFRQVARALWGKFHSHVYLVCGGTETECREFLATELQGFPESKVILDEAGFIFRDFRISETPQGVELDLHSQIQRYGRPEVPDGASETGKNWPEATAGQRSWPETRSISGAAFARVDSTVSCILTRFRLRSCISLIPFYLAFRRVRKESRNLGGLLQAAFLVEDLHTCYTLSLWKDEWSIVDFSRIRAHLDAATSAFGHTYDKRSKRANIWSAQFRLWAVSAHNLDWNGLNFKDILGNQWERREEIARMANSGGSAHVG